MNCENTELNTISCILPLIFDQTPLLHNTVILIVQKSNTVKQHNTLENTVVKIYYYPQHNNAVSSCKLSIFNWTNAQQWGFLIFLSEQLYFGVPALVHCGRIQFETQQQIARLAQLQPDQKNQKHVDLVVLSISQIMEIHLYKLSYTKRILAPISIQLPFYRTVALKSSSDGLGQCGT
ncbi:Hypothetical_protein [Hexamita inflata]|uniref:Hypothetical_protein n=1 Tax=Hexamita inflata TaxID=28002 RepID=A0AA86VGB2_9EUKA|nr:Hypothetical protein HINF_LOCUS48278 [Hexamita inflata]CAI9965848.1 Hypothetical protein HINF_LOCUS53493 [Hexamita inflata]